MIFGLGISASFQILRASEYLESLARTNKEILDMLLVRQKKCAGLFWRSVEDYIERLVQHAVEICRHLAENPTQHEAQERADDQTLLVRVRPFLDVVEIHYQSVLLWKQTQKRMIAKHTT
jgi:hypothetical protein